MGSTFCAKGASDRGIILAHEIIRKCIESVKQGKDPIGVIRDPSHNEIVTFDASMEEISEHC